VNGVPRTYRVFDPSPQGDGKKALVLVLHGGMEQGSAMVDRTQFDTLAQARNIIVAYPDGAQDHRDRIGVREHA